MVPHSCGNKAISAPSWAWAWAELGKKSPGPSHIKLSSLNRKQILFNTDYLTPCRYLYEYEVNLVVFIMMYEETRYEVHVVVCIIIHEVTRYEVIYSCVYYDV